MLSKKEFVRKMCKDQIKRKKQKNKEVEHYCSDHLKRSKGFSVRGYYET